MVGAPFARRSPALGTARAGAGRVDLADGAGEQAIETILNLEDSTRKSATGANSAPPHESGSKRVSSFCRAAARPTLRAAGPPLLRQPHLLDGRMPVHAGWVAARAGTPANLPQRNHCAEEVGIAWLAPARGLHLLDTPESADGHQCSSSLKRCFNISASARSLSRIVSRFMWYSVRAVTTVTSKSPKGTRSVARSAKEKADPSFVRMST